LVEPWIVSFLTAKLITKCVSASKWLTMSKGSGTVHFKTSFWIYLHCCDWASSSMNKGLFLVRHCSVSYFNLIPNTSNFLKASNPSQ
jgi:hypothetical protein